MAEHNYNLYFSDGNTWTKMPPPAKEGINDGDNLIWSDNAGRTANGNFVGDIKAVKKSITITWNVLTYTEFLTIKNAISRLGTPFIKIKYTGTDGDVHIYKGYTEGIKGTIDTYTGNGKVKGVSVNFVEQ